MFFCQILCQTGGNLLFTVFTFEHVLLPIQKIQIICQRNNNIIHQNLRNTAKAVHKGKFLALKEESLRINNLSVHLKKLRKANEEKKKKTGNKDKIEINEIETEVKIKQK